MGNVTVWLGVLNLIYLIYSHNQDYFCVLAPLLCRRPRIFRTGGNLPLPMIGSGSSLMFRWDRARATKVATWSLVGLSCHCFSTKCGMTWECLWQMSDKNAATGKPQAVARQLLKKIQLLCSAPVCWGTSGRNAPEREDGKACLRKCALQGHHRTCWWICQCPRHSPGASRRREWRASHQGSRPGP